MELINIIMQLRLTSERPSVLVENLN